MIDKEFITTRDTPETLGDGQLTGRRIIETSLHICSSAIYYNDEHLDPQKWMIRSTHRDVVDFIYGDLKKR